MIRDVLLCVFPLIAFSSVQTAATISEYCITECSHSLESQFRGPRWNCRTDYHVSWRYDQAKVFLAYLPRPASVSHHVFVLLLYFSCDVNRMQTNGLAGTPRLYKNMVDCFKQVVVKEGWQALFYGVRANTIRAIPATAIEFWTYDLVKKILLPDTYPPRPLPAPATSPSSSRR